MVDLRRVLLLGADVVGLARDVVAFVRDVRGGERERLRAQLEAERAHSAELRARLERAELAAAQARHFADIDRRKPD